MSKIAVIGLGALGAPIARALAGTHEVSVFDLALNPKLTDAMEEAGATVTESAPAAADGATAIVTILPTSAIVESVITDPALLERVASNALFIDQTSGDPLRTRRVSNMLSSRGFRMVDAPICNGGLPGAENATLAIALGGNDGDKATAREVLDPAVGTFLDAGTIGNGHVLKLASNLIANAVSPVVAEAFAVGEAAGINYQRLRELLPQCAAGNWLDVAAIVPESPEVPNVPGGFKSDLAAKDVRYASDLAGTSMIPHYISDALQSVYLLASRQGYGQVEARLAPWALNDHWR